MKRLTCLCAVVATALVTQPVLSTGKPVKDFTLPSARDGSLVRLSDYAGKVVLINWWRSGCGWSQRESPKLVRLYEKYRSKGLVILGVSDDTSDTVADVSTYLKRYNVTWPIGLNDQGEFMPEIESQGRGETPANYIVSRSGQLTFLGLDRGDEAWQKLEESVVHALAEPTPATPAVKRRELQAAPPFTLPDLHGKPVTLASFAGKPLVVYFFTENSCDYSGAVISKLHRDYAGRGLQVVGINLFDKDAHIQTCIDKHAAKYPVLRGDEATQKAWIGKSEGWAVFFVTADGKILKAIKQTIENGLEAQVFPKYAEYLLAKK